MIKKLLFAGVAIVLMSACGTDSTEEENTEQTDQATNEVEESTSASTESDNQSTTDEETETKNESNSDTTNDIMNPDLSLNEVVEIFNEAYPGVKIESIELEKDGGLHYDIDAFDETHEYEVKIDANTKELVEKEMETDSGMDEAIDFSVIISPAEAIEITSTEKQVEGLSLKSWTLDVDDGIQEYTFEYEDNNLEVDIEINAETGEVLDVDTDN